MGIPDIMSAISKGMTNSYLPKTLEADIFAKKFGPLAEFAISPLALGLAPDQRNQMLAMISQLLSQHGAGNGGGSGLLSRMFGSSNQGNQNVAQGNGTLNDAIVAPEVGTGGETNNQYGGTTYGQPTTNASTASDENDPDAIPVVGANNGVMNNPNLPSQNTQQAAGQRALGQFSEQVHNPGTAYNTPTGAMVTPESGVVSHGQEQENNINLVENLIPQLKKDAKEFVGQPTRKYIGSYLSSIAQKQGAKRLSQSLSDDPAYAGRYHNIEGQQGRITGILKNIYPEPQAQATFERYSGMLNIRPDDTEETYNTRLDALRRELHNVALPQAKKAMGATGGYSLNNPNPIENNTTKNSNTLSKDMVWMYDDNGNRIAVHKSQKERAKQGFINKKGMRLPALHEAPAYG